METTKNYDSKKRAVAIFICEDTLHLEVTDSNVNRILGNLKQVDEYLFKYYDNFYLIYTNEEQLNSFLCNYADWIVFKNIPDKFQPFLTLDCEIIREADFETKREFVLELCCKNKYEDQFPANDDGVYYVSQLNY